MMKPFVPPVYLRNPVIQTILNSSHLRNPGTSAMEHAAVEKRLSTSQGTTLQYFESLQPDSTRGTVILLHGWEGSHGSAYIVNTGRFLYRNGYHVVRLNLRDHGTSHAFNQDLFYGTLIEETFSAIQVLADMHEGTDLFVAGFSMGANFACRIAREASRETVPNLKHLLAVNPPLDPKIATERIDSHNGLRKYFIEKWRKSLRINQQLYPDVYNFEDILAMDTCMEMTDVLIKRYTHYADATDYFLGYTLKGDALKEVSVPLTILMSRDDPVIPYDDFENLALSPSMELLTQQYGGHCGYLTGPSLRSWYQPLMLELFR